MNNFRGISNFIWSIADLIRDHFKRAKYQDVILPLTVLRRIDLVLAPKHQEVLSRSNQLKQMGVHNPDPQLRKTAGLAFYNTSPFTFKTLLEDTDNLADNLKVYINGFSENMREVLEKFNFHNTINLLNSANLLYLVMDAFMKVELHPDRVSNVEMGYIFEDLIRRFNESLDENPGEHFTPREVIRLMVGLIFAQENKKDQLIAKSIYDPCCGSGGILTEAKTRFEELNPQAQIDLFGQEVNPETYAMCKSDLYLKSRDGRDADNIILGSTLRSSYGHSDKHFDYQLANPPFGKEWKPDKNDIESEFRRGELGRFGAGLPAVRDGQFLFMQHMLNHMEKPEYGGGRIAVITNGSPLFTGDAGSGESNIRKWIMENDYLEAIIALPEQLFYNTGITTYIWLLTNLKLEERKNKVQLIDATSLWAPMKKSLGDKRREISDENIDQIVSEYQSFSESEKSKIFPSNFFGYTKVAVARPLRQNFQASPERIDRLKGESAFKNLAVSRRADPEVKRIEEESGRKLQQKILGVLDGMTDCIFKNKVGFESELDKEITIAQLSLKASVREAIIKALAEIDPTAEVVLDKDGNPEPDSNLSFSEGIPLNENIDTFYAEEVAAHVPDSWMDRKKDKVGYEINFTKYFYKYQPLRSLPEIEDELLELEAESEGLLSQVLGL